ncbi:uncharacterized protein ASCRUDRAFT_108362 [Ascoidea rubescens DSM 1968]|uniref:C2 NT-type domain-containing protein n=1 Tax=Ascoidea rubescens DSM 1968 TaxID=1344418 RepID=A0A1D2VEP1_9ASCO|nr:hypothetical protein ASCRUDRAFT_108362 [Ascoidea rubescens DSM 1968]ODV59937.1 hypothetical protein ASCRUDRAFT_108362 [Ascoidea rubescens DSM 1968]
MLANLSQKSKKKFTLTLNIIELLNVPQLHGNCYIKWYIKDSIINNSNVPISSTTPPVSKSLNENLQLLNNIPVNSVVAASANNNNRVNQQQQQQYSYSSSQVANTDNNTNYNHDHHHESTIQANRLNSNENFLNKNIKGITGKYKIENHKVKFNLITKISNIKFIINRRLKNSFIQLNDKFLVLYVYSDFQSEVAPSNNKEKEQNNHNDEENSNATDNKNLINDEKRILLGKIEINLNQYIQNNFDPENMCFYNNINPFNFKIDKYLLKDSKINSILRLSINLQLFKGNYTDFLNLSLISNNNDNDNDNDTNQLGTNDQNFFLDTESIYGNNPSLFKSNLRFPQLITNKISDYIKTRDDNHSILTNSNSSFFSVNSNSHSISNLLISDFNARKRIKHKFNDIKSSFSTNTNNSNNSNNSNDTNRQPITKKSMPQSPKSSVFSFHSDSATSLFDNPNPKNISPPSIHSSSANTSLSNSKQNGQGLKLNDQNLKSSALLNIHNSTILKPKPFSQSDSLLETSSMKSVSALSNKSKKLNCTNTSNTLCASNTLAHLPAKSPIKKQFTQNSSRNNSNNSITVSPGQTNNIIITNNKNLSNNQTSFNSLSTSQNFHADQKIDVIKKLYFKTFQVNWDPRPYELNPLECVNDIFNGGNGWKKTADGTNLIDMNYVSDPNNNSIIRGSNLNLSELDINTNHNKFFLNNVNEFNKTVETNNNNKNIETNNNNKNEAQSYKTHSPLLSSQNRFAQLTSPPRTFATRIITTPNKHERQKTINRDDIFVNEYYSPTSLNKKRNSNRISVYYNDTDNRFGFNNLIKETDIREDLRSWKIGSN